MSREYPEKPSRLGPSDYSVATAVECRIRYGCCEVPNWQGFTEGPFRDVLCARHRQIASEVIRIVAFDKGTPDPVADWPRFARYIQAVLDARAVPMITFARFNGADRRSHREWFATRCGDVVWNCIERWGLETVRNWYWCVWSKPNSSWDNPGMTFDHYRAIYETVAEKIIRWLGCGSGTKPLIGGPAADGFQPFWLDWIWRFVEKIDNALIGFVSWHSYSDWRAPGEWRSATDARAFASLVMSRTSDYGTRARAVGRMVQGKNILNICGELNAHAHHEPRLSRPFNQGAFGAVYYASSLLQLIRGGADVELRWSGSDAAGGSFGLMDWQGRPNPVFFSKLLFAHLMKRGSVVRFPMTAAGVTRWLDVAHVEDRSGMETLIAVHKRPVKTRFRLSEFGVFSQSLRHLLTVDMSREGGLLSSALDGTFEFDGYGIAAATSEIPDSLGAVVTDLVERL